MEEEDCECFNIDDFTTKHFELLYENLKKAIQTDNTFHANVSVDVETAKFQTKLNDKIKRKLDNICNKLPMSDLNDLIKAWQTTEEKALLSNYNFIGEAILDNGNVTNLRLDNIISQKKSQQSIVELDSLSDIQIEFFYESMNYCFQKQSPII